MRHCVSVTLRYPKSIFNVRNVTKIYHHVTTVNKENRIVPSGWTILFYLFTFICHFTGMVIVAGATPLAVAFS